MHRLSGVTSGEQERVAPRRVRWSGSAVQHPTSTTTPLPRFCGPTADQWARPRPDSATARRVNLPRDRRDAALSMSSPIRVGEEPGGRPPDWRTSTGNAAGQQVDTCSSRRKPRPRISPMKGGYVKIHNIRFGRPGCEDTARRTAVHTGPAPWPPSARMIGGARCIELREVSPRPVRTDAALGLRAFPGP